MRERERKRGRHWGKRGKEREEDIEIRERERKRGRHWGT